MMRRVLMVGLIFLVLISLHGSQGETILVDDSGGADYDNIQAAIDNAAEGDTILVNNGSYEGNLVIDVVNLTIERNAGTVLIDGYATENGSYITADGVTLLNLNFSNSKKSGGGAIYAGVYVDANDVSIETCELYDNKYGVFASTVSGLTVTDCDLIENRWGVYFTKCGDSVLKGLEIYDSGVSGITVYTSSDITIGGSGTRPLFVSGSPVGVQILGGSTAVTIDMTGTDLSSYGVLADSVTNIDLTLDLWNLSAGGIKIEESTLIDVTGAIEADGRCIYVTESTSVVLTDMYLNGTDEGMQKKGLYLYDGAEVTGDNIYFGNLRDAVYLQDKCNATLTNITLYGGTSYTYDGVTQDSRLILLNVEYQNASVGTFNAHGSGWISSRNIVDIEIDLVDGSAAQNADVKVTCEEGTLYASTGFSGTDNRTDGFGIIYDIDVPYLFANMTGTHNNVTLIDIDTGTWVGVKTVDASASGNVLIIANKPATLNGYVPNEESYTSDIPVAFHCIYMDYEGQEPTVHSVLVNGVEYVMTTTDTDFTNAHYELNLSLMRSSYTYWFEFNDTRETTTTNVSTIVVSNAPPAVIIYYPEADSVISGIITINGSSSDIDGTIIIVELRIAGGNWTVVNGTTDWNYEFDSTLLEYGPTVIEVRAFDGNYYSELDQVDVTIDNRPDESDDSSIDLFIPLLAIVILAAVVGIVIWFKKFK